MGDFFKAIQEASFAQLIVWILLIVAIVWGIVSTTAMVIAVLIALSFCALCLTIMSIVVKSMWQKNGK